MDTRGSAARLPTKHWHQSEEQAGDAGNKDESACRALKNMNALLIVLAGLLSQQTGNSAAKDVSGKTILSRRPCKE